MSDRSAIATFDTPLGPVTAEADSAALLRLSFGEAPSANRPNSITDFVGRELSAYFAGELSEFATPVAPNGTPFQERVWDELLTIPAGQTTSYAAIAKRLGDPNATRAVGAANGANPIAILVPCHRVVRTGGALGGYAGGLERKRWLLDHERAVSGAALFA